MTLQHRRLGPFSTDAVAQSCLTVLQSVLVSARNSMGVSGTTRRQTFFLPAVEMLGLLLIVVCFCAVFGGHRQLPAHFACAQHQCRRQAEHHVRHDLH